MMKYVQQHVNTLPAHTVHSVCCDVFLSVLPSSISVRQTRHQCLTSASISRYLWVSLSHTHTHYSAVIHVCKEPWLFWCGLKFYEERSLFCRRYYSQPLTFSKHVSTASDRPQTFKVKSVECPFIYMHLYCFMKMERIKIHHMQRKLIKLNHTQCAVLFKCAAFSTRILLTKTNVQRES